MIAILGGLLILIGLTLPYLGFMLRGDEVPGWCGNQLIRMTFIIGGCLLIYVALLEVVA